MFSLAFVQFWWPTFWPRFAPRLPMARLYRSVLYQRLSGLVGMALSVAAIILSLFGLVHGCQPL